MLATKTLAGGVSHQAWRLIREILFIETVAHNWKFMMNGGAALRLLTGLFGVEHVVCRAIPMESTLNYWSGTAFSRCKQ